MGRFWRAVLQKELSVTGLNGVMTNLYRRFLWVFFSRPALAFYPILVVVGLGLFIYTVQSGDHPLLNTGGKWYWGILTFLAANVLTVIIHESAHALATIHYSRRVRRGGMMIFFGSPAFFVDTMDIWMEPKKARIAVSWAGPYSGLILGSIAILLVTIIPDMFLTPFLFKLALWSFIFSALMNLNPLLQWDGYFMLMDWLEIPMLRKRSIHFVKRKLINKIASRTSFNREERIFTIFGILAVVYTVFIIGMVLFLWQSRVSSLLSLTDGWVFWLLISVIATVIGIPVVLGIGVLAFKWGQGVRQAVYRRFLKERPNNQIAALIIAALAAALPALFLRGIASDTYGAVAGAIVLALGILFTIKVTPWYMGSRQQWFFLVLPVLMSLLIIGRILIPFDGQLSAIGTVLAHGVAPLGLLLVALILSPTIVSYTKTMLQDSWTLTTLGIAPLLLGALIAVSSAGELSDSLAHAVALVGYGALSAGLYRMHHNLRSLHTQQPSGVAVDTVSDAERLSSATGFLVEGLLHRLIQIYGRRTLAHVEARFNAGPGTGPEHSLTLNNGLVKDTSQGSLLERSQTYTSRLSYLLSLTSEVAGPRFVERQLRDLYRLMPWEEREISNEYLSSHLDWMQGIHQSFTTTRGGHVNLLRSAPLFAGLAEEALEMISDRLRPETYPQGREIVKQGEPGRTFYIIESGAVEVSLRNDEGSETFLTELGRGDYFGERALLNDAPRAATCVSKTKVQVLALDKVDFDELVATRFQVAEELDEAIGRAELLMAMPLFSELNAPQAKQVTSKLVEEVYSPGTVIISQGDIGDKFYVINSGSVEVRRQPEGSTEETVVGELGQGEYFGEIALLMNVPRTASVIAKTDVELLSLDTESFEEVVKEHLQSSRGLEQVSSRRMTQLRRAEALGSSAAS